MATLLEQQEEAEQILDELIKIVTGYGWALSKRGVNRSYAFGIFDHVDYATVKAYYAVDAEAAEDSFIVGGTKLDREGLKYFLEHPLTETPGKPNPAPKRKPPPKRGRAAVPPTADSDDTVPPIAPDKDSSAAHSTPMPPTEVVKDHSAAHEHPVPPTGTVLDGLLDAEVENTGETPLAAIGTDAVVDDRRNWSAVASPLTEVELLKEVTGSEITWINRISNRNDSAVVSRSKRYPPRITPENFDPEEFGEDLRTLHFIEQGAGFRSVAVAKIVRIG